MLSEKHQQRLTAAFVLAVVAWAASRVWGSEPFVERCDGYTAVLPFQLIGVRELLSLSFLWTDRLGFGYPLLNELNFQQGNPLNLLYLFCEPVFAFHCQVVLWIALFLLSSWFCLPRVIEGFGPLELAFYFVLVLDSGSFREYAPYQVLFLSSFGLLPFIWVQVRALYSAWRPGALALLGLSCWVLVNSQYNFTLVPNLFFVGLIIAREYFVAGVGSRRNLVTFLALEAFVLGLSLYYVSDAIEILRHSNRLANSEELARVSLGVKLTPTKLWTSLVELFEPSQMRPFRFIGHLSLLGVLLGGTIVGGMAARATGRRFQHAADLLAMVAAMTALGLALFNERHHLARMNLAVLIPFGLWAARVGRGLLGFVGELTGLAVPAGRVAEGSPRAVAPVVVVVGGSLALLGTASFGTGWESGSFPFEWTRHAARYLEELFGDRRPELRAYRCTTVVSDNAIYARELFRSYPYQPSQAVFHDLPEVAYYGSFLLNGARLERTYEHLVTLKKKRIWANINTITASGALHPLTRLLNVKYFVSDQELVSPELRKVRTVKAPTEGGVALFPEQHLYELARPLPRAWSLPLPPDLVTALSGKTQAELSERLETFLLEGLTAGTIDARLRPLEYELGRAQLRLRGREVFADDLSLVCIAMPYWPAWTPRDPGIVRGHPFGLLALLVPKGSGADLVLAYSPPTAPFKIAGALLILVAAVGRSRLARPAVSGPSGEA